MRGVFATSTVALDVFDDSEARRLAPFLIEDQIPNKLRALEPESALLLFVTIGEGLVVFLGAEVEVGIAVVSIVLVGVSLRAFARIVVEASVKVLRME